MSKTAPNPDHLPGRFNDRYSRQVLFAGIGEAGQAKLREARVVVVGCGATGSSIVGMLARAGVGFIRIIDRDYVEASNLQRQTLFDEHDAAESIPKAIAAAKKVASFNSEIAIDGQVADLTPENIHEFCGDAQLILDATDNFETRYKINDFAVKTSRPWIYSAVVSAYGLSMNIIPLQTACLSCIFPAAPQGVTQTCDTAGVVNSAANLVASIAVTEALKFLVGAEDKVRRSLLSFDLWSNDRSEIMTAHPRSDCPTCQQKQFIYLNGEARPQITLCGRNSVQIHERRKAISFVEMDKRLAPHGRVKHNDFVLKFWRDDYEMTLFLDGRAIIKGTTDTAVARSLYARFVGS
jgi:molybdopterin/thiamine biosynthesis adenylyltransferase